MADAPARKNANADVAPYHDVTLREYCRVHGQPFIQIAAHRVIRRLQRSIPGLGDDRDARR